MYIIYYIIYNSKVGIFLAKPISEGRCKYPSGTDSWNSTATSIKLFTYQFRAPHNKP